jgi:hypothetical protein
MSQILSSALISSSPVMLMLPASATPLAITDSGDSNFMARLWFLDPMLAEHGDPVQLRVVGVQLGQMVPGRPQLGGIVGDCAFFWEVIS